MLKIPRKILVVRNDKLGDFMLAFPSFALLKNNLPDTELHALVPRYTSPLAEHSQYIDRILIDPGANEGIKGMRSLIAAMRQQSYDAVITLFSTTRIGMCVYLAGIPYRLAPATKFAQLFYNQRITQRRSRSDQPEYKYNIDLANHYLKDLALTVELANGPYLHFDIRTITALRNEFNQHYGISGHLALVFIHPGSGGSANNLSIQQYAQLIRALTAQHQFTIVISSGPGEKHIGDALSTALVKIPHIHYHSTQGLLRFAQHINMANLFISGSTGPLHIAGALDIPTVGFYPTRRSATALRWQTLNKPQRRLAISPKDEAHEADMSSIDIEETAQIILNYYASLFKYKNE